jgi:Skp family chaperone for outer membrane proteins
MKISKQILNAINSLAKKYNFNVDEAVAYLTDAKTDPGSDSSVKTENDKVETCRKNIALWQKKLDEGKIKDELREKHVEKIDKEQKKLDKLLSSDSKDDKSTKSASSEKKEQRIKKVTPATASQLKTALEKEGVEVNDENKKKFVEEYKQYVNDMPEDDYMRSGSGDVMKAFAKLKLPPAVTPVVPVEAPAEVPVVADKKKSRIDRLDGKKLKASFERESVEFKED